MADRWVQINDRATRRFLNWACPSRRTPFRAEHPHLIARRLFKPAIPMHYQKNLERLVRLESIAARVTAKYQVCFVGGILGLYLVLTVRLAQLKPIWTDEFFTLYLSRLGPAQLWRALLTGGDQHPPPFYLLHHVFLRSLGEVPWVLRLPSILGFLMMMLCLFWLVARRTSVSYGLLAMLVPLVTVGQDFAYEARGYSLLLGFGALAAICWQQSGDGKWRIPGSVGLAAALIGGVCSHYYAVLLIPAFALAEAVRSLRCKRWAPGTWVALSTAVVPLIAFYPLIRASSGFAATFWAKARLSEISVYYQQILGPGVTGLLLCLALGGMVRAAWGRSRPPRIGLSNTVPPEEFALGLALSVAPIVAYGFGKAITGVFAWRYAIGGALGLAMLFTYVCFRLFRGSVVAAWLMVFVCIATFSLGARAQMHTFAGRQVALHNLIAWLARGTQGSEPLVIGDSEAFYELSYYSPAAMQSRYVYLADTNRARKYLHHDTIDRSIGLLAPWFRLNVQPYQPYLQAHPRMTVFWVPNSGWNWLLFALVDEGRQLTVLGQTNEHILFVSREREAGSYQ